MLAPVGPFDDMEVDERHARSRRNVIGETVDKVSSIFLKNYPVVRRWPYLAEHAHLSDELDAMWLWAWDESDGQSVLRCMLEDAEITGLGAVKVLWDPRNLDPDRPGKIVLESIPAGSLYVDPFASNSHRGQDVRWIVHHTRKLPEELVARYGDEAAIALGWRSAKGKKSSRKTMLNMLHMTREAATRRLTGEDIEGVVHSDDALRVDVYEAWIFPDTMYGAELVSADKPKSDGHPYGIVATMIEDKIVRTIPNPFVKSKKSLVTEALGFQREKTVKIGHKRHPFVFLWWKRTADTEGNRRFYDCMGMVEWMVSLQFNVDALRTNIAQNARTIANPMVAYNEDALASSPDDLIFAPGQILRVHANFHLDEAIRILEAGAMPEQVFRLVDSDIQAMQESAGVLPGVIGLFPAPGGGTSHTPAATIGTLQESAFGPLWKYVEEIGNSLRDLAILYDGLMQQKYKEGHYLAMSRQGQQTMIQWSEEHALAQFRYETVSGATTPLYDIEKQAREGQIVEITNNALVSGDPRLMQTAVIYLQSLDYPWGMQYIQLLQQEMEKLQQQQMQQQEAMQALGAGELMRQQQGLPGAEAGGQDQDGEAIESLANELGISPEELMLQL